MKIANTRKHFPHVRGKSRNIVLFAIILCVVVIGIQNVYAQEKTRIVVEPDNFPLEIGILNQTIEANGGDVIYVLKNGATYFVDATLEFQHFLHFEAEEYPSDNPPIVRPGTDLEGGSQDVTGYRGSVLMRGIFFYGRDDMGGKVYPQRSFGESTHIHLQYCYISSGRVYHLRMDGINNTVRIEDTQMNNVGLHNSIANQRFLDPRGNDTDSLIVINSSIYNFNERILRAAGARFNYVYFDHVTIVNNAKASNFSTLEAHVSPEVIIKNSLFHNTGTQGVWESADLVGDYIPDYSGPYYVAIDGHISVTPYSRVFPDTTVTDADRNIVIKNNVFTKLPPQAYLDNWVEMNDASPSNRPLGNGTLPWVTDPQWRWENPDVSSSDPGWALRDTIRVVRIMVPPLDSTLRSWESLEVPWATIENNIHENVVIDDMPPNQAAYLRAVWWGTELPFHYDRMDEINADPFDRYYHPGPGTPTAPTAPTAAWFRNLAYNSDSEAYTHAENNYPVGNLNYYPELREKWEAGEVIVNIDDDYAEKVGNFRLIGNYPNPFNPTTTIVFELGTNSEVLLEIFNVLGQRVASMDMGIVSAGQHQTAFNAANLTSGIYVVRLQMGSHVQTHKITLLK